MTTLGLRDPGFLAAAGIGDPLRANRLLVLHANGSNGSTTFADNSANNWAITTAGNAQISTAQSKFGGSSAYFDGSGDWLNAAASASPQSGNFTIEAYVYPSFITGADRIIWDSRGANPAGTGLVFFINGNARLQVYGNNGNLYAESIAGVTANTWQHVALVSSSGTLTYYINKIALNSFTATTTQGLNTRIGARQDGAAAFTGYIDEFIITSTALTPSQFTYDAQVSDF